MLSDFFDKYINTISQKYSYKETSEMGYRADFEDLLKHIFEPIPQSHILHDSRSYQGNKPDFIILKDKIPLLHIEVKDIGISLDKIEKSNQMSRYFGYDNLILSDYLEFRFYRLGIPYGEPIQIGKYDKDNRTITPIPQNFDYLAKTVLDFTQSHKEPIRSGKHLAKIMGGKAQRIRDNIRHFFSAESEKNTELVRLYETMKELLVNDLNKESFADMYAQTLVYGLFVARFYDKSQDTFSRQEARELIPNSNPLLRHFFDHIVGVDFDSRLKYIVDELCEVFSHANVTDLMEEYFQSGSREAQKGTDPVVHFYEDFLKEYDPELRKKMGAYYTPLPVVQFIVRSVDYLLKEKFGLLEGLADISKSSDGLHKVQVLDPAVGTGTFISTVIGSIYAKLIKNGQKGRWPAYVHNDLLPRIYGFELMMAPYTIAHLKLGIAFRKTGFWDFHRRLGIYLTNSLEQGAQQQQLFAFGLAESIAEESKEASKIKNEKPIMVVIGNPPYSVSSSNKGEWIQNLIKDYKQNLNERNIQPLSDDYIKFIRFAENFIEKNSTGIVAMITNNSFLDGLIHRQMRKHLLNTFDDIYILNLHGNSKKHETAPDGSKDENVFDIQQGVSINIFVKKKEEKNNLATVYYSDLYGKRTDKFEALSAATITKIVWQKLNYSEPYYFFVPKNFEIDSEYETGFKIDELFNTYSSGIQTQKDNIIIQFEKQPLEKIIREFESLDLNELNAKYKSRNDSIEKIKEVKDDLLNSTTGDYQLILYRPFDERWTYYTGNSSGVMSRPRDQIMSSFVNRDNIGLQICRQQSTYNFQHVLVSNRIVDRNSISMQTREATYFFPLYNYSKDGDKTINLKKEIVSQIEKNIGNAITEDIFDYIYAILHSPHYREKSKEFLKIDFPRIPYPKEKESFNKLVTIGGELRRLHLLESQKLRDFITTYPEDGSNIVEKIVYKHDRVYINETQYFGKVSEVVWTFWIGGYQPAQKWLKDRKGRKLTNDDIEHYQKMNVALFETSNLMKEIDQLAYI